jgi:hypothetical protein
MSREEHVLEAELRKIAHAHGVEDAIQVIHFMLHHPRMKTLHRPVDGGAEMVTALVAQLQVPRHQATHAGYGQTAFPAQFLRLIHRCQYRIDEHGLRHCRRIRIAVVVHEAEDHHPLRDTDLRRREAGAVGGLHGVLQVADQRVQLGRVEFADCSRVPQQQRIAHAQNRPDSQFPELQKERVAGPPSEVTTFPGVQNRVQRAPDRATPAAMPASCR